MSGAAGELSALVHRAQAQDRLPSIAVHVQVRGETVLREAVGLADVEQGVAATPETQYRVGSITKTLTAVSVLQLVDEGKVGLDDPLGRHLPEVAHGELTLRRLLSHASGLQREPPGDVWETLQAPSREELLAGLGETERVLEPQTAFHYSNLAFALLGEVVARVNGAPYQDVVQRRLLDPLGMTRTSWSARPPAAHGYLVMPYSDEVRREPDLDEGGTAAAGQAWSTVDDLVRWAAFLARPDESLLSAARHEAQHQPQIMLDEQWRMGWGLGVWLTRRGDRVFAGHDGAMPGHLAGLAYHREERVCAALATNTTARFDPGGLAVALAEKAVELCPSSPEPWRPGQAPPPELAGLDGRWWSEGSEFVFSVHDGQLHASLAGSARAPAVFAADGPDRWRSVRGRERGELLRVVRDGDGAPVKLYWAGYPFHRDARIFGA